MHISPGESAQLVIHQRRQLLDHGLVPAAPLSQHSGDLSGRGGGAHRNLPEGTEYITTGRLRSWYFLVSSRLGGICSAELTTKTLEQNFRKCFGECVNL